MSKTIMIVDYDPTWPTRFQELRDRVATALGELIVGIEHVGSTSIPGCAAKPIIDLDVVISSMADLPQVIARLAMLGYVHEGNLGIADREAFKAPPDTAEHHLYVCSSQSKEHRRHLLFRDYLRAHPDAVQAYQALKHRLAHQFRNDRDAYTQAKSEFIEMILQRAGQDVEYP